ncbi:unnamed protein product [Closterium sp. Naga37s-1]|nr:unnamed protein product [Closterium sp. Naga37s-1]
MAAVRSLISSLRLTPAPVVPLKSSASSLVRDESSFFNLNLNLSASCASAKGPRRVAPPSAAATPVTAAAAAPTAEDAPSVAASGTEGTPRRRLKVMEALEGGAVLEDEDLTAAEDALEDAFLKADQRLLQGLGGGGAVLEDEDLTAAEDARFSRLINGCCGGGAVLEDEELTAAETREDAFLKADQRLLQWLEEHSSEPESGSTGTEAFVCHFSVESPAADSPASRNPTPQAGGAQF